MQVIPDPTTVHFHLPGELSVRVHRGYNEFIAELINKFPHDKEGIHQFYNECWKVCHSFSNSFSRGFYFKPDMFSGSHNHSLVPASIDLQCTEFIGIEIIGGASISFWTVFQEAIGMLDSW